MDRRPHPQRRRLGVGELLGVFLDHFRHNVARFFRLRDGEIHGGEQSQHGAVRAVDEQLAIKARLDDRGSFHAQLDADHHAEYAGS